MTTVRPLGEIGTKLISILLTIVLVISLAPVVPAWADEGDAVNEPSSEALQDEVLEVEDDPDAAVEASEDEPQDEADVTPEGADGEEAVSEGSPEEEQFEEPESALPDTQVVEDTENGEDALLSVQSSDGRQLLESGTCGENVTWAFYNDYELVISGTGEMENYPDETALPWNAYLSLIEVVTVEEGVTTIGEHAFSYATATRQYNFSTSIVSIGAYAFSWNRNLQTISFPDNIASIGDYALTECTALSNCRLPDGLTRIPAGMFTSGYSLKTISIPSSVEEIGERAFYLCLRLTMPVLPDGIKAVGKDAFTNCSATDVYHIPGSLENVGASAFAGISFKGGLVLDEGISSIEGKSFSGSDGLFIQLPASIESIASASAFLGNGFSEIAVNGDNARYCVKQRGLYEVNDDSSLKLIGFPGAMTGAFDIAEGTTDIDSKVFGGRNHSVTSVSIPSTFFGLSALKWRDLLFNLEGLESITVAEDNPDYSSESGLLLSKDAKTLMLCPRNYQGVCVVPGTVTSMESVPFSYCLSVTDVVFPQGLKIIPDNCFLECNSVSSIYIPKSVEYIGSNCIVVPSSGVLQLNVKYVRLVYGGTESQWNAIRMQRTSSANPGLERAEITFNAAHYGVSENGLAYVIDNEGNMSVSICDAAINDANAAGEESPSFAVGNYSLGKKPSWMEYGDEIVSVSINDGVAGIGSYAFYGCKNLERASLPASVLSIGEGSFGACPKLVTVDFAGDAPAVASAESETPSFDADVVTLCYSPNNQTWDEAPNGLWNGYACTTRGSDLPQLASVTLSVDKVVVKGMNPTSYNWGIPPSIDLEILDGGGNDISDLCSVAVGVPESPAFEEVLKTKPNKDRPYGSSAYEVSFDNTLDRILVGSAMPSGDYSVVVTPVEGKAAGQPVTASFKVEREPEVLCGTISSTGGFLKGMKGSDIKVSLLTYNQYMEDITSRCSFSVLDVLSDKVITDNLDEYGVKIEDGYFIVDRLSVPREYRVTTSAEGISGNYLVRIAPAREESLKNVAYELTLTKGEDEIALGDEGTWASIPYHTRIVDAYLDPCWPDVTWKVSNSDGKDVTGYFEFDEQDYVFVKGAAKEILSDGANVFTVTASSGTASDSKPLTIRLAVEQFAPVMHTATFKVGETVIGEVAFAEGDVSLEEPVLPVRENYLGAWEEYDLASATDDIVVEGRYTPIDPDEVSDITGESSAVYDNGAITVNLAAVAASKQVKVESSTTKPVDVILVLDQSGSMAETLGAGQTKRDALVQCANEFLQQLYDNAAKTGADHRVALVGFAYSNYNNGRYKNTGLLATANGSAKGFAQLTDADYRSALLPVAVNGGINQRVVTGVNSITAEGATAADVGLKMAKNIFSANPVAADENGAERERIVIFITDGVPTCWGSSTSLITSTAAEAITMAQTIKRGQGARIYSVGVDAAADPSAAFTKYPNGVRTALNGAFASYDLNRFLHAISSNYPEAAGMDNLGDGAQDGGFYLAVNDTSSLGKIFTGILYSKVYSIDTFDSATLAYTLPSHLVLTMKQEDEMRAALAEQGLSDDDVIVEPVADGTTKLIFKNVKVATEYVDGVPRYVAKVSFRVSATQDASGNVAAGSGGSVLFGGDTIGFEAASVDVPSDRCLLVFKVNDAIYEIRDAAMGDAITLPDTNMARWLDLEKLVEQDLATVSEPYAVFETSTLTRAYNIRWVVGDNEMVSTLKPGEGVSLPDAVAGWVPDGYEISGWSPSLPATMPARNITCAAVVSPQHVHDYTYASYRTGSCDDGIVTHHACTCGDEQTEVASPKAHSYEAVLSQNGLYGSTVEKLVCADCGHSVDKNVTYTVSYSNGWRTAVLDLSKYENSVMQEGASSDAIAMRFYVGDASGKPYTVTRVDADGKRTTYTTRLENGYLTFDPDHFSIYVIDDGAAEGGLTYEECLATLGNSEAPEVEGGPEVVLEEDSDAGDDGGEGDSSGKPSDAPTTVSPSGGSNVSRTDQGSSGGSKTSGANQGSASGRSAVSQASSAKSILSATVSGIKGKTYTGKLVTQVPVVKLNGTTLRAGVDYVLSYRNNLNVGIATMTITGKGAYTGSKAATFAISKAKNTLKVKAKSPAVKASKLKKKAQSVAVKKALAVSKAKGKVTYAKVKKGSSAKLSINKKTGKITVKKGAKKGTYKIKVKVTAKGDANYKAASKTVTVKVKVKVK